ncbi:MAG: acetyl-CoA C-acetyltransferase [Motiliproteus sp.]
MKEVVIVAAGRTAIGRFNGSISEISASDLGATVIKGLLEKTGIAPEQVDEVILGQVLTAGCGQNPARQAVISAGLPQGTPALTINNACGSGLKAVLLAAQAIELYDADLIIAGGQDNMSLSGHFMPNFRNGIETGNGNLVDTLINDGLWDVFNNYPMGIAIENLVEKYGFSREAQDVFAAASQNKAEAALAANRFADEIIPVVIPQCQGEPIVFDRDEQPRAGVIAQALGKLSPAFKVDGTVTAGNSSPLNDGAAIVIVCSAEKAEELGLEPLANIAAYGTAAVDPSLMGTGSISATQVALNRAGWTVDDLDLIEASEAFAAQTMSVNQELEWGARRVNVNGGSIALGHPIGASSCRLLVSLLHEMVKRDAGKGLAAVSSGDGMGITVAVER